MDSTATRLSVIQRWALMLSCAAVALIVASMAALYTALPEIAAATGATQQQLTWIVDGYTLALACLVLPGGALGDRYGRRRMLLTGLGVFALFSAVPLLLDGPIWLIAARSAAGVGAALVMPSTLSLLTAGLPESRRGVAVGMWAGSVGMGAVGGILVSGVLLQFWTWLSIMAAMSASSTLLAVTGCVIPESIASARPGFDPWGTLTSAIGVGLIVAAATETPQLGWSHPLVIGAAIGGLLSIGAFALIELRMAAPLLDVRLFADRRFGTGTASVAIQFLVSFGMFMLVVQFLQLILGYRPLISALAMAPMMIPFVTISPISPWLAERFGLRLQTFCGLALLGVGLLAVARLSVDGTYFDVVWPLLIVSLGISLSAAPATTAITAGVPADQHGVAAAVNDVSREVGAAIGIALAGSILAAGYGHQIATILPMLPQQIRGPISGSLVGALAVAEHLGPQAQPLADAAKAAFVHGVRQAAAILGALTLVAAVAIGLLAPGRRRGRTPPTATTSSPQAAEPD
ncbi:MFS transporter [Nocardia sp. CA-084685]|uniref:MFS transporter n=1 Tax=Nocardia sp. CA-084685 TaxID=3239970 RepID=UPI003D961534